MATTTQQIQEIYVGLLGRAADADGLAYWVAEIDGNTLTIDQLRSNIVNEQAEYAADLGTKTRSQVVNELYERMFERSADAEALAYWVDGEGGGVDVEFLVFALSNGAVTSDKLVLDNKVEAATYYTANTAQVDYTSGGAEASISDVDATSASIDASKAAVDAGTLTGGQALALTTAGDNLVGGAGNDTISGLIDQATPANSTITAADTIDGGDGIDTLSVTGVGTTLDILGSALVSNVEIVDIRATTANTIDASQIAGLTTVNANLGTGTVIATNLATGAAMSVTGNGTVVNGQVAFAYATATDAVTLNVAGGTAMTAAITAKATLGGTSDQTATTATINSTGAANVVGTVDLANATLTTVTINATTDLKGDILSQATDQVGTDGAVTISGAATTVELTAALDNTIKTIDASGLTAGGIKATVGTGTEDVKGGAGADTVTLSTGITTATFGAGNDTVTTAAVTTTTASSIDGGEGTDTLVVAATAHVDTAAERAVYTGFETLSNGTTSSIAADGFSGTTAVITAADGGGFSALSAAQASDVTVTVDQTGVTYALGTATGLSDALTLALTNATATSSADAASLTVDGFETLNVSSNSGNVDETNAAANIVSFASATDLGAINISGAFAANLILDNTAKAVTVASTQSGTAAMKVEGEVIKGSSVTTTGNADTIETALAAVAGVQGEFASYDAGVGDDAISTTLTALNNTNNAQASLKIEGGAGTDTLTFATADATFADANFQYVTGVEKVTLANTTALSFTSGGFFDTNFKTDGITLTTGTVADAATVTIDVSSFTGAATIVATSAGLGNAASEDLSINTGTGADNVTLTAAAWVGAAGAASNITVGTGAGADTISLTIGNLLATTSGNIVVNGGTGADAITVSHTNDTTATALISFTVVDGDSTAAGRDKITGFLKADGTDRSDVLDFGTSNVEGNTAGTDGTDSGSIASHAIASGIITFDDVGTFASALVVDTSNLSDVLTYLATNISTAGDTVAFAYDSDNSGTADATIVFNQGASDSVIELVGVTGVTAIGASAVTANLVAIG